MLLTPLFLNLDQNFVIVKLMVMFSLLDQRVWID